MLISPHRMFVDPGELYAKSRSMFCSMGSPLHVWFQPHAWQAQFDAFTMRFFFAFHRADILPSKGVGTMVSNQGFWSMGCVPTISQCHSFSNPTEEQRNPIIFWRYTQGNVDMHTRIGMLCIESIRAPPPPSNKSVASDGALWSITERAPNKIMPLTWSQNVVGKTSLGLRILVVVCKVRSTCHWSQGTTSLRLPAAGNDRTAWSIAERASNQKAKFL